MRIRIIVCYVPRYQSRHRWDFVPPVTGVHLAALTPKEHSVEVVHEQVREVPIRADVDLVALTFFSGFADRAYQIANAYRALGVPVIAGGPHVSYWQEEALQHVDSIVIGEADEVWPQAIADAARTELKRVYHGAPSSMQNLPTPRYELLEERFIVRRVVQATRGCPFTCSFCSVPDLNPGFRVRPIADVIGDIKSTSFAHPIQDKVVWFWDDNLLVKRSWAKELLREMIPLKKWWLTQASIDITRDPELLQLMRASGCIGIFIGIESLADEDLRSVHKAQNRVREYRAAIEKLHALGICVMAGFISGFDTQTRADILATPSGLDEIGVDVPFLSVLTPFRGTPLYDEMLESGRLIPDRDWSYYNGYNVAFVPKQMTADELHASHRAMWCDAFSPGRVLRRLARGATYLSPGAMMLSGAMNGFYGLKRLNGHLPRTMQSKGVIVHEATRALTPLKHRSREKSSVTANHG